MLNHRQPDLTVLMEDVHKHHNLAAIARTADAVGVGRLHAVSETGQHRLGRRSASGTQKWVDVVVHETIASAAAFLRGRGFRLVAADPEPGATAYDAFDYTGPTALVFGAELDGLSTQARELADARVGIPLVGMVESLNVSVAAALLLFEARRQRTEAGCYDARRISDETFERLSFEWTHPSVAAWCRRHARPYPPLDEDGAIMGSVGDNVPGTAAAFLARVDGARR